MYQVKIPNKITKDLAYLCGVVAGDGNIYVREHKHDYSITCAGNPKDEIEYYDNILVPLFKKIFDIKIQASFLDSNKTYGIRFSSKKLVLYLTEFIGLPNGNKFNKLKIPKVFKKDNLLITNFIQGVADTDFGFCLKKKKINHTLSYPVIVGSSHTKNFMEEIGKELDKMDLKPLKYFNYKRKDDRFKKGYSIIHRLEINGHENLLKWIKNIGFRHPKMHKRIELWRKENKKKIQNLLARGGFEFGSKNNILPPPTHPG